MTPGPADRDSTPRVSGSPRAFPENGRHPTSITIGVPDLHTYHKASGIGRVLHSLREKWSGWVDVVDAPYRCIPVPFLRNIPVSVQRVDACDLLLHPRIFGAQCLKRADEVPSIAIVHDVGIVDCPQDRSSTGWFDRRATLLGLHSLRHATRIVAVSQFTSRRLIAHMPELEEKVITIPDGVDEAFLDHSRSVGDARLAIERILNARLGSPVLLYVGSELPRKNTSGLLQAYRSVLDDWPNATLLKIGRAGDQCWREQTREEASSLGIQIGSMLHILEDVDDQVLADAYRAADVFVTASEYEGFGLPVLEAMAMGTPVVATKLAAFEEVCGEVGWLVEPIADAIAAGVNRALTCAERAERVSAGLVRAQSYRWDQIASQYAELFFDVLRVQDGGRQPGR